MNKAACTHTPRKTGTWRLHGYTKDAGGIICQVFDPEGCCGPMSLADFAKLAASVEWDNRPGDIQAMLELAAAQGDGHE